MHGFFKECIWQTWKFTFCTFHFTESAKQKHPVTLSTLLDKYKYETDKKLSKKCVCVISVHGWLHMSLLIHSSCTGYTILAGWIFFLLVCHFLEPPGTRFTMKLWLNLSCLKYFADNVQDCTFHKPVILEVYINKCARGWPKKQCHERNFSVPGMDSYV